MAWSDLQPRKQLRCPHCQKKFELEAAVKVRIKEPFSLKAKP